MSTDFKKENQGNKSTLCMLEPLINQRNTVLDLPQEVEDEDPIEEEVDVVDVEDTPKSDKEEEEKKPFDKSKIKCYIF